MPAIERIQSDPALPGEVDVVIIGGGIIGVAAAYYLAKQGTSVALLEKGIIAGEQSSRNWGWCRQQNRDEREVPLAQLSLRIWNELGSETGRDLGFRQTGIVFVSDQERDIAAWERWSEIGRRHQVQHEMLSAAEASAKLPGNVGKWIGGVYCPTDGRAEPGFAAPRLAQAARDLGATVHQNCAARGLATAAGRVSGVITERRMVKTSAVLCAGGAWASMFCRRHGIRFPQAGVRSVAFNTTRAPEVTQGNVYAPDMALRRRIDGGYTVGLPGRGRVDISPQGLRFGREFLPMLKSRWPKLSIRAGSAFLRGPEAFGSWSFDSTTPFEQIRVLDPPVVRSFVREGIAELKRVYPTFRDVQVAACWGGLVDATPDSVPIISPVDTLPGFYLAAGFSGHGFGIGPAAGQLAATLITGRTPVVDPRPFRFARLGTGQQFRAAELL